MSNGHMYFKHANLYNTITVMIKTLVNIKICVTSWEAHLMVCIIFSHTSNQLSLLIYMYRYMYTIKLISQLQLGWPTLVMSIEIFSVYIHVYIYCTSFHIYTGDLILHIISYLLQWLYQNQYTIVLWSEIGHRDSEAEGGQNSTDN